MFPFVTPSGNRHDACTLELERPEDGGTGRAWCSVRVRPRGHAHVTGHWGYCDPDACPEEPDFSALVEPDPDSGRHLPSLNDGCQLRRPGAGSFVVGNEELKRIKRFVIGAGDTIGIIR